jgi:glycosyltransferase involved in cell wall biosynthesis
MTIEKSGGPKGDRSPVVSVVIPAYDTARYIGETLDSVFDQTFRDFEVIVVNDGSPDTADLEAVLQKYRNQIRYIKQQNRGPASARNTGMRYARGQFLVFLDGDDIWLPDFLADLLDFLEKNPLIDMACADCVYFGDPKWEGTSWQSLHPLQSPVTFEELLPTHGGACMFVALLRKGIASKVGFFEEELRILEDYHYWMRLVYHGGKLAYVPKILGKRRMHPGSLTYKSEILPHAVDALQRLSAIIAPGSREAFLVQRELAFTRSRLALREGKRKLAEGDYEGARKDLDEAYAAVPSGKVRVALLGLRWAPEWTRRIVSRRFHRS